MRVRAWLALAGLALLLSCNQATRPGTRVIVLGLDGCDPTLLRRFMQQNKLPHFARLQAMGGLWNLATTTPPQSPVAWATFLTGQDPGGHGLFDFVHRDPVSMEPRTSMSSVVDGHYQQQLKAPPFWTYLAAHQIPATLLRVPCQFPAPSGPARLLTGLGTPDMLGSYGTFSYYSEQPARPLGGGTWVQVEARNHEVSASLIGPREQSCPLHLRLDIPHQQALIEIGEPASQPFLLKRGEWSPWVPVAFAQDHGMVRFLLRSLHPLNLYVSPLNDDPTQPGLPISQPTRLAAHLARCCGRYYTQGMAEDSKALSAQVIDDADYLVQSRTVLEENHRLLSQGLSEFSQGLFFFYISHLDLQSHLFWRDPSGQVVEQAYRDADKILGEVLAQVDSHTTLWVLSDHGFAPFERVFDLNAWLVQEGYLESRPGQPLPAAAWDHSRAYGVGFNGLYLNRRGRESHGIVTPEQGDELKQELKRKLLQLRDPQNGKSVFRQVYEATEIYSAACRDQAPDLILGYQRGYRVAWETALGQRSSQVFRDNLDHWNGDHLIDPQLVPGVLLCSQPIRRSQPALQDLAPTILNQFHIQPPPAMLGHDLLER